MSQYKISKKRLAQIIKEEYQSLQELEDPRRPSPMSYEHEGAADDFRQQIMNLVLQLGPLTLEPKLASAVEIEIRDVLNTLGVGTDPRSGLDAGNRSDELEEGYMDKYDRAYEEEERERRRQMRRIEAERERNRRSGGYRRPGPGSGSGGIGGGGKRPERFAGFNRDDELENPDKADLDDDGKLSGYEKKRGKAIEKSMKKSKKVKEESLDSLRDLIQQELKKL